MFTVPLHVKQTQKGGKGGIIIIIIIIFLQLSCHSVAVVHTQVQTKQIRIHIHKRNSTKTQNKHFHCYTVHVVELLNYYTNYCTIPNWYTEINVTFYSVTLARTIWPPDESPRTETFRSVFNVLMCKFYKFYISAAVGIIIE